MKISAFRAADYKFTADLWGYTESTDAAGGEVRHYAFDRTVTLTATTTAGTAGKMTLYFLESEADVRQFDQLQNFKGPDGVELHPHGVWSIDFVGPNINIWGRREGLKARATLFAVNA